MLRFECISFVSIECKSIRLWLGVNNTEGFLFIIYICENLFLFIFFLKAFSFLLEPIYLRTLFYFLWERWFLVLKPKGQWKAIQEKSENEGFIIQKTLNPWNRYFESQHFFFFLPILPSLLHLLLIRVTYFFNTNIYFIYFYFNFNTPEKRERERERERAAKTEYRVGVGGNGGWWVSK